MKYFFTRRDAKFKFLSHGQSNRAARSGYWKAEGKAKQVVASWHNQVVGMKKVLVFYRGKSQTRTDWIMHEYLHVPQRINSTHVSFQFPVNLTISSERETDDQNAEFYDFERRLGALSNFYKEKNSQDGE